jgi:hypothetical protein
MQAILYPGTRFYYKWRNAKRAAIWDHMTSEEKSVYLRTTSDEGNKRFVIGSSLIYGLDGTDSLHIDWISDLRTDQEKLEK